MLLEQNIFNSTNYFHEYICYFKLQKERGEAQWYVIKIFDIKINKLHPQKSTKEILFEYEGLHDMQLSVPIIKIFWIVCTVLKYINFEQNAQIKI